MERLESPFELELYMKADRRLNNVEIIEATESNVYVVCCEPRKFTKVLCALWKHYARIFEDSLNAKVQAAMPEGVIAHTKIVCEASSK
jgi:hypothetical protein